MKRSRLKRTGPPERKTPLERTTPIKPVNATRRLKRFLAGFGSEARVIFVQSLPCVVCGAVPSENAHVRSRGAGGGPEDVVPMCQLHHREQHDMGQGSFRSKHGVDLKEAARRTEAAWRDYKREEE